MTCEKTIRWHRNSDLRLTYTFPPAYNLFGFSPKMQIRLLPGDPDPALLTVELTPTGNGSAFQIYGNVVVLTIEKQDLLSLPYSVVVSDPWIAYYDIILTDQFGFENYFVGGPFVLDTGVTL